MAKLKTELYRAGDYRVIRLSGDAGDFFRTHHTESYPRSRNPNVVVMVSGTLEWGREDGAAPLATLVAGDTGDKLPDPEKGEHRFVARTPVLYYCVSRADGGVPRHRRVGMRAEESVTVRAGGIAILLAGSVKARVFSVSAPGAVISMDSGAATVSALTPCALEVFE